MLDVPFMNNWLKHKQIWLSWMRNILLIVRLWPLKWWQLIIRWATHGDKFKRLVQHGWR